MNKIGYFTLAAARMQNPTAFDQTVARAVKMAAKEVGAEALARSLAPQSEKQELRQQKAA